MSRWRDKAPPASPYITVEGYQRLEKEMRGLWSKRDEVRQALSAAAAEGDRSENAEYIYRKKQLREIDRRITYLQKRMPTLEVVRQTPQTEKVFFSATVEIENDKGELHSYKIVGADEIDMEDNWISIDSPMARALLGKSVDDEINVRTKNGQHRYIIIDISY